MINIHFPDILMVIKRSNYAFSIPKEDLIIKLAFTLNGSLSHRGRGRGGREEVWDRGMMFSQLAKQSPCVLVSG